jgi:hypothetical protein
VQTAHSDLKRLARAFSEEITVDAGDGLIVPNQ